MTYFLIAYTTERVVDFLVGIHGAPDMPCRKPFLNLTKMGSLLIKLMHIHLHSLIISRLLQTSRTVNTF